MAGEGREEGTLLVTQDPLFVLGEIWQPFRVRSKYLKEGGASACCATDDTMRPIPKASNSAVPSVYAKRVR